MDWFYAIAAVAVALAFAVDVWLVETGRTSISWDTWIVVNAHPIIIAGLMIAGGGLSWLTQGCWPECFTFAVITGHLITADSAAVLTSGTRWLRKAA